MNDYDTVQENILLSDEYAEAEAYRDSIESLVCHPDATNNTFIIRFLQDRLAEAKDELKEMLDEDGEKYREMNESLCQHRDDDDSVPRRE